MLNDIYTQNIIELSRNPNNYGELAGVLGVCANNSTCGDELTMFIDIKDQAVREVRFTGVCCALATASASLFTDHIKNKKIIELRSITPGDVYTLFAVPVTPIRSNCVLLVYVALEKWLVQLDTTTARGMVQS